MSSRARIELLGLAAIAAALGTAQLSPGAYAASPGYDGAYHGDVTLTRGAESLCGKSSYPVTYTVVNGQFSIVYDNVHHVGVNLQVQPDGSFSGSQQYQAGAQQSQVKASGRISGNVLDAQVEGVACARKYHLTKS
jgi:hypothetical protein